MNEEETEERVRKATQGVWVLEYRKLTNGRILKKPEISGVIIYTPRYAVSHFVMNDDYASAFEEYTISGSKIKVVSLSSISSKPSSGQKPKATNTPLTREIEARVEGDKVQFRVKDWERIVFEGDKCTNIEEQFVDTYKRVELLQ